MCFAVHDRKCLYFHKVYVLHRKRDFNGVSNVYRNAVVLQRDELNFAIENASFLCVCVCVYFLCFMCIYTYIFISLSLPYMKK